MKYAILTVIILPFVASMASAQFAGGAGTDTDPYQIATLDQLQAINDAEFLDKHFVMTADIDASDTETWNEAKGFAPIGLDSGNFTGTFDGNGYVISNLFINRDDKDGIGLFSSVSHGTIKNVVLNELQVTGADNVGGIIGSNFSGSILNSGVSGVITGNNNVGGLIGDYNYGSVNGSFAIGTVTGISNVGGLAGFQSGGGGGRTTKINSCYAHVDVKGEDRVGGLVGYHPGIHITIEPDSYSEITESYAAGEVTGNDETGGLVGRNEEILNSLFWDMEISGQNEGVGSGETGNIKGLPSDKMKGQNAWIFMNDLDFDQTWQLTEGYPVLKWQVPDDAVDPPQVPFISVRPAAHDFTGTGVNTSRSGKFTVENTGNVSLNGHASLAGPDIQQFEIVTETASFTIEPDSTHIIEVIFNPENADSFKAVLEIQHDAPNEHDPIQVLIEGAGLNLDFAGGTGTEEDPWQVATLAHLDEVRWVLGDWFIQTADIDASETRDWHEGLGFEPIGTFSNTFSGTYDGNGFSITNLTINRESESSVGLFGDIRGGMILKVKLISIEVLGRNNVGGLAGVSVGNVNNSHVDGKVVGKFNVGGLIGSKNRRNAEEGYIYASSADVEVSANSYAGGLLGYNTGEVIQCNATGNVTGSGSDIGGLVGQNGTDFIESSISGKITDSYATGDVVGNSKVGGLAGQNGHGEIQSVYSNGKVLGSSEVGGLIGDNKSTVLQSYWDMETSGRSRGVGSGSSSGIIGYTTDLMAQQNTFENWDFEEVWTIMEGESYPWLQKSGEPVLVSAEEFLSDVPVAFKLHPNHPNPFNPVTTIAYDLPAESEVVLDVYDILGRRVAVLVNELKEAGVHQASWDATNAASGLYIYRLRAGDFVQSRPMLLVK